MPDQHLAELCTTFNVPSNNPAIAAEDLLDQLREKLTKVYYALISGLPSDDQTKSRLELFRNATDQVINESAVSPNRLASRPTRARGPSRGGRSTFKIGFSDLSILA